MQVWDHVRDATPAAVVVSVFGKIRLRKFGFLFCTVILVISIPFMEISNINRKTTAPGEVAPIRPATPAGVVVSVLG